MRFISTQLKTLFPKKIATWTINTRNTRYIHEPKIKHDTYTKTNLIHEIHTRTIFK